MGFNSGFKGLMYLSEWPQWDIIFLARHPRCVVHNYKYKTYIQQSPLTK